MSLIGFGMEAVTRVAATTDPELVAQGVESLEVELVRDGTNISGAVLTTISRLLESDREPRVVVLLTDGLWRRRLGGGPDVIGRTIAIEGRPHGGSTTELSPCGAPPTLPHRKKIKTKVSLCDRSG